MTELRLSSDQKMHFQHGLLAQGRFLDLSKAELSLLEKRSVCVVVITYNSAAWIESCFRGLSAQSETQLEVVVVDNCSTDGTLEAVERCRGKLLVTVLPQSRNLGYAAACNIGIRHAFNRKSDYALILNPDVELLPRCLAEMTAVYESRPSLGPVSPIHISRDAQMIELGCLWFLAIDERVPKNIDPSRPIERYYPLEYIFGAIMLMSRSLLESVGLFDELFYFYGEDNDLCRRSHLIGHSPAVAVRAQAYHWHASGKPLDEFRRTNMRQANYQLILKKPTRPFALNCAAVGVKFLGDAIASIREPAELRLVWRDLMSSARKFRHLYNSRRHDIRRIHDARTSS